MPEPCPQQVLASGARYLQLATTLLQRIRLASPTGGIWEAADIQWWSRKASFTDDHDQIVWLDADGGPVAGVLRTDFTRFVQVDVAVLPGHRELSQAAWQQAASQPPGQSALFPVRADDAAGLEALTDAGYRPTTGPGVVSSWLRADERPAIPRLPPGCRLLSRADTLGTPHPLEARNGPGVALRLTRCSLYRPELDLVVLTPGGTVAGYGLFWADPVTRVGLVEPMRTEPEFQGRGIASHILAAGLDRLARTGCDRVKVSNDIDLYRQAGFRPLASAAAAIYARPGQIGRHR